MNKKFKLFSLLFIVIMLLIAPFMMFETKEVKADDSISTTKKLTITKKWINDDEGEFRPNNITVHIKKTGSLLLSGSVNSSPGTSPLETKIKQIAGSGSADQNNSNIKAIKYATDAQYEAKKDSLTSSNEIQQSGEKTYMWFDSTTGTMYMYSKAGNIYLPPAAGGIFRKMTVLTDISGLSHLNTTYATDMNRIFQNSKNIEDFSPIANWDVSNVQNLRFAFGHAITTGAESFKPTNFEAFKNWDVSSVKDANQIFKCWKNVTDISGLKNWKFESLLDAGQMFNYLGKNKTGIVSGLDELTGFDMRRVTSFSNMFNNTNMSSSDLPIFTLRPGSWTPTGGSYNPTDSPLPAVTPPSPGSPILTEEKTTTASNWVKNGNTWTYEFTVSNDNAKYEVWEDDVANFKVIGKGSSSNHQTDITDSATIKNINQKVRITKSWIGDNNLTTRPSNITAKLSITNSEGTTTLTSGTWDKTDNDNWKYTFTLSDPKEDDVYKVWEDTVPTPYSTNAESSNKLTVSNNNKATITNTIKTHDITIEKMVYGNLAEKEKTFNYNIKIYDTNDDLVTSGITGITANGINVSLKHGESTTISNIPEGYKYVVDESDTDYDESYKIVKTDDNTTVAQGTNYSTPKTELTEDHTVSFSNTKEASVLTGIFINNLPFIALILLGFIGINIINVYKKRIIEY